MSKVKEWTREFALSVRLICNFQGFESKQSSWRRILSVCWAHKVEREKERKKSLVRGDFVTQYNRMDLCREREQSKEQQQQHESQVES